MFRNIHNCISCVQNNTKRQIVQNYIRTITTSTITSNQNSLYIFDRNAKYLQRERAASAADANLYDYLKEEVGYRLADRVFDIKRKFKVAADIGSNRSFISKHIQSDSVEKLLVCDMSQTHLNNIETNEGIEIKKCIIDEENINLEENSLEMVISSLCFHWVNDLPGAFSKVLRSLKNDGVFLAAVFGGETLYELRSSIQLAELERKGGLSPHVSPFTEISDIGSLLNKAGFTMLTIDTDEIVIRYPTMFELMWDLKGMGESNAALNRSLHLDRDVQLAAGAIYQQLYGVEDEKRQVKAVPATFQIIYMLGWKPDVSQPKPLERGTGQVSLKDISKFDEIAEKIKKSKKS